MKYFSCSKQLVEWLKIKRNPACLSCGRALLSKMFMLYRWCMYTPCDFDLSRDGWGRNVMTESRPQRQKIKNGEKASRELETN